LGVGAEGVGRPQGGAEEVADGVVVFEPIEAMQRLGGDLFLSAAVGVAGGVAAGGAGAGAGGAGGAGGRALALGGGLIAAVAAAGEDGDGGGPDPHGRSSRA